MRIDAISQDFKSDIQKLYAERLKAVVLYGSWARNEASDDSDIDVAVVLSGDVEPCKEIDRMIDIITDMNLEHGVLLSVYPVSQEKCEQLNSPLIINLRREGVPV
jgi:predicted nucleotidyltransferase